MILYLGLRLAQLVPSLLLASVAVFLIVYLVPGDPAAITVGPDATREQLQAHRLRLGLDRPLPVQYGLWLERALHGDLGVSLMNGMPVWELILRRLPVTFQLTVAALVLALAIALPVGTVAAIRPGSLVARIAAAYAALAMAVPTFWLGLLLVLLFGLQLKWLPSSGYVNLLEDPLDGLRLLILPSLTLAAYVSAVLARFLRSSLRQTLREPHIRTARAKGLTERAVLFRHALKAALIPVVTVVGLQFGSFMGGAVVTEAIFDYPGIGRMMLSAIQQRDYTIIQGTILVVVTGFFLINLATDLVYAYLDPRIKYG